MKIFGIYFLLTEFLIYSTFGTSIKESTICFLIFYLITFTWGFCNILKHSNSINFHDSKRYATSLLAFADNNIKPKSITIVDSINVNDVKQALDDLQRYSNIFPVVGMDAEMKTRTNKKPRVELLQFATKDGDCILLRTTSMSAVPKPLSELLSNNDIWKVGIAVFDDASYLLNDYPGQFEIRGTFDLRYLAHDFGIPERGLKKLAARLLNIPAYTHDSPDQWDKSQLTPSQQMYAAMDAYVGVLLFQKFYEMYLHRDHGISSQPDDTTNARILQKFFKRWEFKKSKQFRNDFYVLFFTSMLKSIFRFFSIINRQ